MSVFEGMTRAQLVVALTAAQTALIELQTGNKAVSMSYSQGDGAKSVTRKMTTTGECRALILQLQIALGIAPRRRAATFVFQ